VRIAFALVWLVALGACAAAPSRMIWLGTASGPGTAWPAPPAAARYVYEGDLVGEANFVTEDGGRPAAGQRLLRWLVGLGSDRRRDERTFARPIAGAVGDDERIYVADIGRGALFVFDPRTARLAIWSAADGGTSLRAPTAVCVIGDQEVLVSDAELHRVVRLDPMGRARGSFGADVLTRPVGLACDTEGRRVFVADTGAHDVKVFDLDGRLLARFGRRGSGAGEFNGPTHIQLAGDRLYVADTLNARVEVVGTDGGPVGEIGRRGLYLGNLTRPKGVAVDRLGHVHVVESYYDHLLVFDSEGRFLLPIGGTGSGPGQFFLPAGVWCDAVGRVFVADMFNGRVAVFRYVGT